MRTAQDEQLRLSDTKQQSRARARLLQAIDAEAGHGRAEGARSSSGGWAGVSAWRWGLGAVAAGACAFALMVMVPGEGGEVPLSFSVDDVAMTAATAHEPIVAQERPVVLTFNDDTRIELEPGTQAQLDDLLPNGALVELDHGGVELSVHHADDTSWRVAAGPWRVHVTGTQFSVDWDPSTEAFSVAVTEGSVRVVGVDTRTDLSAGQSFNHSPSREAGPAVAARSAAASQSLAPGASGPNVPSVEGEGAALESGSAKLSPGAKAETVTEHLRAAPVDWQTHYGRGDYAKAWSRIAGLRGGAVGEADRLTASEMLDLADVARFSKQAKTASEVLERLRERFPATRAAGDAAYSLGQLAAGAAGGEDKAAKWFEIYLDERPNGALTAEAMGRLMDLYGSINDTSKREAVAQRYLAKFPTGPQANKAKQILGR